MTLFYSKSTKGFYDSDIHTTVPDDSVEITKEKHRSLLSGQSDGKQIVPDENGFPILVDPPEPSIESIREGMRCTRRQGRRALLNDGKLGLVESSIDAIEDDVERMAARIDYEADTWERSNETLQTMWSKLGGTPEQLDDLFRMAVTL